MDKYADFNPPFPKKRIYKNIQYVDNLCDNTDDYTTMNPVREHIMNHISKNEKNYANMVFTGTYACPEKDPLLREFFGDTNIKLIQQKIRKEIFRRSNGNFKLCVDQTLEDILVVMRAIIIDNAKFLPFKISKQLEILNNQVVDYVVPDMLSAIKQQQDYLRDINNPLRTLSRPIDASNGGKNVLPSITSLWK